MTFLQVAAHHWQQIHKATAVILHAYIQLRLIPVCPTCGELKNNSTSSFAAGYSSEEGFRDYKKTGARGHIEATNGWNSSQNCRRFEIMNPPINMRTRSSAPKDSWELLDQKSISLSTLELWAAAKTMHDNLSMGEQAQQVNESCSSNRLSFCRSEWLNP